ncbi:MAG: winged helix-turn-helix domain-containing protein [Deltaproteobacteria bacterium]|nr:winged helix-turn-helix domain-containing protein [Deltaproteobacteria bacterium]
MEEILRETAVPMSVREIVERAGVRLPSKSKTPDTVVARDLSMDIKKKGEGSLFVRTTPGRYTLRALATGVVPSEVARPLTPEQRASSASSSSPSPSSPSSMSALPARKPAVSAPSTSPTAARPRSDREADGGGFAS